MNNQLKPIRVLLIEDNPGDVTLTKKAFERGRFKVDLTAIMNGAEALDFIFKRNGYESAEAPDLILLDLNLPEVSGFDVLEKVKSNPATSHLPVAILTTSNADEDILKAYKDHANCFITKPVEIKQFLDIIQKFEDFWITVVKTPRS